MRIAAALLLLSSTVSVPASAADEAPTIRSLQDQINQLQDRLNKIETAPEKASLGSFNPAIGMAFDAVLRDHNDVANFDFRAAELNIEAAADPFVKVYSVITGSNGGVAVEETAAQTTSLPHNLTARGGRFFAPFGHFGPWHDHELPMAYRPNSLNAYIGGESQGDGLDVNYLFPTPFYLEGYVGAYDKIGANNTRADNGTPRPLDQFTYLGRLHAYGDLLDNLGADLGFSDAWTPKRLVINQVTNSGDPLNKSWRALAGVDLTLRYQPSIGGLYHGFLWSTEVLQDNSMIYNPATNVPLSRGHSYAGYSNIETKLGRVTRLGGFADLTEIPYDNKKVSKTFAGYLTFEITEFNRVRIQYSRTLNNFRDAVTSMPGTGFGPNDLFAFHQGHMIALQWSCVIGYHVHGFRGRWGA